MFSEQTADWEADLKSENLIDPGGNCLSYDYTDTQRPGDKNNIK